MKLGEFPDAAIVVTVRQVDVGSLLVDGDADEIPDEAPALDIHRKVARMETCCRSIAVNPTG
jgi:hypothetical protein